MKEQETEVRIETPFIKLEALLKFTGWAGTGGEAKIRIQEGEVAVNGAVCTERGRKIRNGDRVALGGRTMVVAAPCE